MEGDGQASGWTCIRSKYADTCPKCGVKLEPLDANFVGKQAEDVCPTHPQIVREGPGMCPICDTEKLDVERDQVSQGHKVVTAGDSVNDGPDLTYCHGDRNGR